MVEDYPFAVAVGFLGVGVLTGLLLPRTRQEDKLVGEKSDQLLEQVKETGKENLEKAKAVAQRITKTTMDEAERQGITSEAKMSEIASKIGTVATKAKEEAFRTAEELKRIPNPEGSKKRSEDDR
jgi:polyhydroxyalkanoate synthesis regulator phasin